MTRISERTLKHGEGARVTYREPACNSAIYFLSVKIFSWTTQHQTAFNDKGRIKSKLCAVLVKLLQKWLRHYRTVTTLRTTDTEGIVCTVPSLSQQPRHCYTYVPALGYKHATQGGSAYAGSQTSQGQWL